MLWEHIFGNREQVEQRSQNKKKEIEIVGKIRTK